MQWTGKRALGESARDAVAIERRTERAMEKNQVRNERIKAKCLLQIKPWTNV